MAVSRYNNLCLLMSYLNLRNVGRSQRTQLYSQYAPSFRQPIFQKSENEKAVKELANEEIRTMNIRAAESFNTCSVFYDADIALFIRYVMRKGKKEVARNQVEKAFAHIKHLQIRRYNKETNEEVKSQIMLSPREVFYAAVKNSTPQLTVSKLKKSGTWYQVPVGITDKRAKFLAMRWLIEASKNKERTKSFYEALGEELIMSSQGEGKAVKKKLELHKLCETNRSYAHYKWT